MKIYQGLRPRGRAVAAVLLGVYLTGCAGGWRATAVAPAQYIEEKKPETIRVTTDSIQAVIHRPHVAGDSVVGVQEPVSSGLGGSREDSVSVALAAVRKLEVPHSGTMGTVMILGAVALAVVLIAAAATDYVGDINFGP